MDEGEKVRGVTYTLVEKRARKLKKPSRPSPLSKSNRDEVSLDHDVARKAIADRVKLNPREIPSGALRELRLGRDLEENIEGLRTVLGQSQPDLVLRRFTVGDRTHGAVLFFDTLTRAEQVSHQVLGPLLHASPPLSSGDLLGEVADIVRERTVESAELGNETNYMKVLEGMTEGKVALLLQGMEAALLINLIGYDKRAVEEPATEVVVRGPREGLTEDLHTNMSLIRRRIGSPLLRFETIKLGRWTRTSVAISYIHGLAGESLINEVKRRLEQIDIDGIIDSSYIESFIEDTPWSSFPQVLNTERPDVVAANLLEGRVAIIANGSPFALVVPTSFWSLMHANEDYYQRWDISTFVRLLRFTLISAVLLLPSLYVAATTFHPEMLPSSMLTSIAAARESVPFSTFTEVLMMELTFEALREAGVRLPRPVGQTISIVGALVIGQAAVQAQIVSAPVVIIVAFTGVASFVLPHFNLGIALRLVRFGILILAGTFGLFGISWGLMLFFLHLITLRSFGLPYLAPLSPLRPTELKDMLVRVPMWRMFRRPKLPDAPPTWREGFPLEPHPPETTRRRGTT